MNLNSQIDQTLFVKVRNKDYPISVTGTGVPCLVIGLGTLMQRTLSPNFKKHFKVYSSDLYWSKDHQLVEPLPLTMQQIVDDIEELRRNLGLSSTILVGHSAYGIVALEYAKQYLSSLSGIIMIGTPVNLNAEVAANNNHYFEAHADPIRKRIDLERKTKFASEDLSHLDPAAKFLREYIWRDGPRYWHDPTFDCTPLWEGLNIDGTLLNHFFTGILPEINVQKRLEKISCPVFLAAGMSDYDCCPWMWAEVNQPPPKLSVSLFNNSGHYPNYEEHQLFGERIVSWARPLGPSALKRRT